MPRNISVTAASYLRHGLIWSYWNLLLSGRSAELAHWLVQAQDYRWPQIFISLGETRVDQNPSSGEVDAYGTRHQDGRSGLLDATLDT